VVRGGWIEDARRVPLEGQTEVSPRHAERRVGADMDTECVRERERERETGGREAQEVSDRNHLHRKKGGNHAAGRATHLELGDLSTGQL